MYSEYQPEKKKSKRRILLIIGGVAAILIVSGAVGFFLSMTTSRITNEQTVKDELITQNTRLTMNMVDATLSPQAVEQVKSNDDVALSLKVSPDGKTYCIEAYSRKDSEAVQYHMLKDTPATEPVSGLCGDNAKEAPEKPANFTLSATGSSTASFSWSVIPEAKSYVIQCSVTQNFASPMSAKASTSSGTIEGLTSGIPYFCRVSAENSAGVGAWSETISIFTNAQVAVPKGLAISTVSSTSLSYKWGAVVGAQRYILEYATDPNFSENVQKVVIEQTEGTLTNLKADSGYFFHVKVITSTTTEQQAPFSEIVQGRTTK